MSATLEQVQSAARELLAEFGEDYIFTDECMYGTSKDADPAKAKPLCLVGKIAAKLDPRAFERLVRNERGAPDIDGTFGFNDATIVAELTGETFTQGTPLSHFPPVMGALFAAQRLQDGRETWGDALELLLSLTPEEVSA